MSVVCNPFFFLVVSCDGSFFFFFIFPRRPAYQRGLKRLNEEEAKGREAEKQKL